MQYLTAMTDDSTIVYVIGIFSQFSDNDQKSREY